MVGTARKETTHIKQQARLIPALWSDTTRSSWPDPKCAQARSIPDFQTQHRPGPNPGKLTRPRGEPAADKTAQGFRAESCHGWKLPEPAVPLARRGYRPTLAGEKSLEHGV
ncbi:hypothetical protein MN608_02629 [Microdochium nivale]|nr:hypothetical protein MN608_02629 [Microdochium nivale]